MTRPRHLRGWIAAPLALAGLIALSRPPAGRAESTPAVPDAPATLPAAALGFGPVGYFQNRCVSCHGNYGAFYGDGFAADLSDADLADTVAEMCEGPGRAPLDGDDLAAEVAYHRSLAGQGGPFVAVVSRDGTAIRGEVTPGSTVRVGDASATVDGHDWHADVPANAGPVVAERDGRSTTLPPGSAHSHAEAVGSNDPK